MESSITVLDQDTLAECFSYLDIKQLFCNRRVCREWKYVLEQSLRGRRRICLENGNPISRINRPPLVVDGPSFLVEQEMVQHALDTITTFCDLKCLTILGFAIEAHPIQHLHLKSLRLDNCVAFSDNSFQGLFPARKCDLEEVVLRGCDLKEDQLRYILEKCENLVKLDVSYNPYLNGEDLNILPATIQSLDIRECENISTRGVQSLIAGNGKKLKNCLLGGYTGSSFSTKITDVALDTVCARLSSLERLSCIFQVTGGTSLDSLGDLIHLRELTLVENSYNCLLTNDCVRRVLSKCKELTRLSFTFGTGLALICDEAFDQIDCFLPRLEELRLENGSHVTNSSLEAISRLAQLRTLHIVDLDINDDGVEIILANTPSLLELKVSFSNFLIRSWDPSTWHSKRVTNRSLSAAIFRANRVSHVNLHVYFNKTAVKPDVFQVPSNLCIHLNQRN